MANKYVYGQGVAQNNTKAVELYRKACDGNYMMGCSNLGNRYEFGLGVTKSISQANFFYRKACNGGYSKACSKIK